MHVKGDLHECWPSNIGRSTLYAHALVVWLLLSVVQLMPCRAQVAPGRTNVSIYLEPYLTFDDGGQSDGSRYPFLYSYDRKNEVSINLALVRAQWLNTSTRGNVGFMLGTYAESNLAGETEMFRNVFEANAGIKLVDSSELWLDAGIMPSHIGTESAIGSECWSLTRSLLADNSPYYQAGVKVSYSNSGGTFGVSGLLLNGWQRIRRSERQTEPSYGTQVFYKPVERLSLNWSTFIGQEVAFGGVGLRAFSNLLATWQASDGLWLQGVADVGRQQFDDPGTVGFSDARWHALMAMARAKLGEKFFVNVRAEHFSDPRGLFLSSERPAGTGPFVRTISSIGSNVDWQHSAAVLFRVEYRRFFSTDPAQLGTSTHPRGAGNTVTGAMCVQF